MQKRLSLILVASALAAAGAVSAQTLSRGNAGELAMAMPSAAVDADSPGASGPDATGLDAGEVRAAIEANNARWADAFRRGDLDEMATVYTPGANLLPPASPTLEGPGRIVEYFASRRRAGMADPTLTTVEVTYRGDIAYEVGSYGFRFAGEDGAGYLDSGRYFTIWKLQADGSWRYQAGTWTSNRVVRTQP